MKVHIQDYTAWWVESVVEAQRRFAQKAEVNQSCFKWEKAGKS